MAFDRKTPQCPTCFDLDKPWWDTKPLFDHVTMTVPGIDDGVERGCAGCKIISCVLEGYKHELPTAWNKQHVRIELDIWDNNHRREKVLHALVYDGDVERKIVWDGKFNWQLMSVPDKPSGVVHPPVRSGSHSLFSAMYSTDW
jgi:hypothetical protein